MGAVSEERLMVRYTCSACGAGVDLPMPALPQKPIACPNCHKEMTPPPPPALAGRFDPSHEWRTNWSLRMQMRILGLIVAIFWVVVIFDVFLPKEQSLVLWGGIRPREVASLVNIFTCPFVHDDFVHLIANTIPFVIYAWIIMIRSSKQFLQVSLIVTIVSGLGIWLCGTKDIVHFGASGVIFGYLGFLLLHGYFERRWDSVLLSIVVAVFFGGALWGLLPTRPETSWSGHVFGFLGGVLAARLLVRREPNAPAPASARP
jgi:membrane associated rhomboid family serine protease